MLAPSTAQDDSLLAEFRSLSAPFNALFTTVQREANGMVTLETADTMDDLAQVHFDTPGTATIVLRSLEVSHDIAQSVAHELGHVLLDARGFAWADTTRPDWELAITKGLNNLTQDPWVVAELTGVGFDTATRSSDLHTLAIGRATRKIDRPADNPWHWVNAFDIAESELEWAFANGLRDVGWTTPHSKVVSQCLPDAVASAKLLVQDFLELSDGTTEGSREFIRRSLSRTPVEANYHLLEHLAERGESQPPIPLG